MLEPNDRQLLRDSLRPPSGYMLDRAVTTTFSLDLMALLTIPVSFTFFQLRDHDGPPAVDPLALLEALRRYAGRITVFCQAGQIHVPKHVQLLLGYLENSVHPVQAPKRSGVFHPKLTVLRYTAHEGGDGRGEADLPPVVYRVLCSSRNLTFDRSWDTMLVMDGVLAENRTNAFARNRPLARFVAELPDLSVHPLPDRVVADVKVIADELLRVAFEIPDGFDEMEFCPLGLEWTPQWPILKHRRTLAVAPFVDDAFIRRFQKDGRPLGVISRPDSLDELSIESLGLLFDTWYMNTAADPIPTDLADQLGTEVDGGSVEETTDGRVALTPAIQLHGLHAKLFVCDDGWDAHVWTGSANATIAAFERNVEFMVHLTGKKSLCGVANFLGSGDNATVGDDEDEGSGKPDGKLGFGDLLVRYERDEAPVIDATRKTLERMLDTTRYTLAGTRIVARVEPFVEAVPVEGVAGRFRVTLAQPMDDSIELPMGVAIACHPLTLRPASGRPVTLPIGSQIAVFEPLRSKR